MFRSLHLKIGRAVWWALAVCLVAVALVAPSASGQAVGDASAGYTYALRVCANCHAVDEMTMRSVNPAAPPFTTIARTPGLTMTAFNVFMVDSHKSMPQLIVPMEAREDLFAYLKALKSAAD